MLRLARLPARVMRVRGAVTGKTVTALIAFDLWLYSLTGEAIYCTRTLEQALTGVRSVGIDDPRSIALETALARNALICQHTTWLLMALPLVPLLCWMVRRLSARRILRATRPPERPVAPYPKPASSSLIGMNATALSATQ